jgi:hypothetical protein
MKREVNIMCNKYERFSRVNEYEKHDLVEKMNKAMDNFDFEKEVRLGHSRCIACIHECKGCDFENKCLLFEKAFTTEEYWKMIKEDNAGIDNLCKLYGLNKNMLYKMLKNKIPMDEFYAKCLNARLFEVEEFIKYTDEVEDGEK